MENILNFIEDWQTLVWTALGSFLAVIIAMISFVAKSYINKVSKRKEQIRIIEITLTQNINELLFLSHQLTLFTDRIDSILKEISTLSDDTTYCLQETNFPPTPPIRFDSELIRFSTGSNYLHNKICGIDSMINSVNACVESFADYANRITTRNELIISRNIPPIKQRLAYQKSLESYSKMVKDFIQQLKTDNVQTLFEANIYNRKLLLNWYFRTLYTYERTTFRYFNTKKEEKEYKQFSKAMDRIDSKLEEEVNKFREEIEATRAERGMR